MYFRFLCLFFVGALWSSESLASRLKCLVDTPAQDRWGYSRCFGIGLARKTTAIFQVENAPANFKIIWSDGSCNQNSITCRLSIFQYQTLTVSAYVLDLDAMTFETVQSTAMYEGYD